VQDDRLEATIAYNKAVGNRFVIIPGLPGECTQSIAAWRATAAKFNEIAAKLAPHGLFLGYHNHWDEFNAIDGQTPFDVFFGATGSDVVVQLDNGNAQAGDADMLDIVKRYPGRLRTVHLKPYSKADAFDTMLGEDDVPWGEFLRLCDEVGKTEWFIVEYESETLHMPLTGVKLCLEALKKMEAEGKI
jgi:sugar phosphate isomerase/epimerase